MASKIFLALLLPGLAAAAVPIRVPSPVESGKTIPLKEGARLPDGTWAVQDTAGKVWYSVNQGATWALVPEWETMFGRVFGCAVLGGGDRRYWMASTGWRDMTIPASYHDGMESFITNGGERSFFDADAGGGWFYVSDDSLRTWREVFQLPTASLPPDEFRIDFHRGGGRYWFIVADSGYLRGTTDGRDWVRVPLPEDIMVFTLAFDQDDPGIMVVAMDERMRLVFFRTEDLGNTWEQLGLDVPGSVTHRVGKDVFTSITQKSGLEVWWIGSTRNGPWTKVELAGVENVFTDGGRIYAVGSQGLFQVELSDVGVRPSMARSSFAMRRIEGRLQIDIPKEMSGASWKMLAANGRLLASGAVRNTAIVVDIPQEPAWLQVDGKVQSLPRF